LHYQWQQQYEQRYIAAMEEFKLEAVSGLAPSHTYCKAAGAAQPPRRLAKRLVEILKS